VKACVVYSLDSIATGVTAAAGERVAQILEDKGFTVFRFDSFKAVRSLFELQQLINPSVFVAYFGHGDADRLFGQLPIGLAIPLVDLLNMGVLREKVVYTIACRTGLDLGKKVPARAYLGSESWMYVALPAPEHNYMEDYIDTWIQIPQVLAEGKTVREAYQAYEEKVRYYLSLYEAHPEWPNVDVYAKNLRENLIYYRLYGDPNARIV